MTESPVNSPLTGPEIRVLGALIEKEITTPEYYPLTLNSLAAACNQKSNRWPVTEYPDNDVLMALSGLRSHGFAAEISGSSRATKYGQRFTEKLNLGRREIAILCVLMLRGRQTLGEIKGRTERMYSFADLDEVELVLHKLMDRAEGALARKLDPSPGMKEPRYAQAIGELAEEPAAAAAVLGGASDRLSHLEAEVERLKGEVAELKRRLDEVL
jgi:uncharacterized protein YceH (UPF0502 family)